MAHTEKCRGCRNENRCDFIHCTSEREKEIREQAIDEFAEKIKKLFKGIVIAEKAIDEIATELKGE